MKRGGIIELTPAGYYDLRQQSKSFEQIVTFVSQIFTLTGAGEAERLRGHVVSASLFGTSDLNAVEDILPRCIAKAFDSSSRRGACSDADRWLLAQSVWR